MKTLCLFICTTLIGLLSNISCEDSAIIMPDDHAESELTFYKEFVALYDKVEQVNDLANEYAVAYHNGTIAAYSEVDMVGEDAGHAWALLTVNFAKDSTPGEFTEGEMEVVIYGKGVGMRIFSELHDVEVGNDKGVLYNGVVKSTKWIETETMREYEVEAEHFTKTAGTPYASFEKLYAKIYHEGINTATLIDDRLRRYESGSAVITIKEQTFTSLITSPVVYDYVRKRYTKGAFEFCQDGAPSCFVALYALDGKSSLTITRNGSSVTYPI